MTGSRDVGQAQGPWRPVGIASRHDGALVVAVEDGPERGHLWTPGAGDPPAGEVAAVLGRVHHPALPRLLDVVRDGHGQPVAVVTEPIPEPTGDDVGTGPDVIHQLCSLVLALDLAGAGITPDSASPFAWVDGQARLHDLASLREGAPRDRLAAIRPLLPPTCASLETPDEVLDAIGTPAGAPPPRTRSDAPGSDAPGADPARRFGLPTDGRLRSRSYAVVAAALVVGGLALTTASPDARTRQTDDRCPAAVPPDTATTVLGDVDGDGCTDAVGWDERAAEAVVHPAAGPPAGYVLGDPGDQLLVGDWDADGVATPALYRPSTGVLATFGAWPSDDGGEVTAESRDTGIRGGRAELRRQPGEPDAVAVTPPTSAPAG